MLKKYLKLSIFLVAFVLQSMEHPFVYDPMNSKIYAPSMSPVQNLDQEYAPLSPISACNPELNILPEHQELFEVSKKSIYSYADQDACKLNANIENELSLINDSINQTAIAVFEIPEEYELYYLTEQEIENAKAMFKAFKAEEYGKYIAIRFKYNDKNALPKTRAQAIYLIYCTNVINVPQYQQLNLKERRDYDKRVIDPLNEVQHAAIHAKEIDINALEQSLIDIPKTEISHQINNAQELFTAFGSKLSPVDSSIKHQDFQQRVVCAIDHYINLVNCTTDIGQQLLFGAIISSLAQLYDSNAFQNININAFNYLHKFCNGDEYKFEKLAKMGFVLAAMGISLELIIHDAIDFLQEILVLAQMITDITITTGQEQLAQINNWMDRISQKVSEKYAHLPDQEQALMTFANLKLSQISTLVMNEFLGSIKNMSEQGTLHLHALYEDYFKNVFKSDEVLDENGKIFEKKAWTDNLNQDFKKLAEGFALNTPVLIGPNLFKKISELMVGDSVYTFNFETLKNEYKKITYIGHEILPSFIRFTFSNSTLLDAAHDERFYIRSLGHWATAQEMKNDLSLAQAYCSQIQAVTEIHDPFEAIKITVEGNHNFYVTQHKLLVHNFGIEIGIGSIAIFGPGAAPIIIGAAAIIAVFQIGNWAIDKHRKARIHKSLDNQTTTAYTQNTGATINVDKSLPATSPYVQLITEPSQTTLQPVEQQYSPVATTSTYHLFSAPPCVETYKQNQQQQQAIMQNAGSVVAGFCLQCFKPGFREIGLNINNKIIAQPIQYLLPRDPTVKQNLQRQGAEILQELFTKTVQTITTNKFLDIQDLKNAYKLDLAPEILSQFNNTLKEFLDEYIQVMNHRPGTSGYTSRIERAATLLGQYSNYIDQNLYHTLLNQSKKSLPEFAHHLQRSLKSDLYITVHDTFVGGTKELVTDLCRCVKSVGHSAKDFVSKACTSIVSKMDSNTPQNPGNLPPQVPGGQGGPPLDPDNIPELVKKIIEDSVKCTMKDANKLHHIFDKVKHKLGPLLKKLGSKDAVVRAILIAGYNAIPESGVFLDTPVNVEGFVVIIRGFVANDGIIKLATFFIK